jgi:thymidylate synthase ThyX
MSRLKELKESAPEEGRVFAVVGVAPEPGAYGTAKFSRSATPFARNVEEITGQQAAEFLNTFYFQYGHPSIADLDHFTVAFEGWSMVHALALWQENLVDGQESSTRYQDYTRRRVWVPVEIRQL